MSIVTKLETELELVEVAELNQDATPEQVLATVAVWVPVMIVLCSVVKVFTGAKADAKIDAFIAMLQVVRVFK